MVYFYLVPVADVMERNVNINICIRTVRNRTERTFSAYTVSTLWCDEPDFKSISVDRFDGD